MGEVTGISWCDHTFNPWWGCEKVSPACDNCYAESTSARYGFKIWGQDAPRRFFGDKHWAEPLKWNAAAAKDGVRRRVFCASMADVMEDRPDLEPLRLRLYELIKATPGLDWLLLTKRPENFARLLPGSWLAYAGEMPQNIWGMTTVEAADYLYRANELAKIPFAIRGVSVEPMLESFSFGPKCLENINWVIVGSESGHKARFTRLDWVRGLRDECRQSSVSFFVKQLVMVERLTKDVGNFPSDLQIRELPTRHV
jgi:protein gp37